VAVLILGGLVIVSVVVEHEADYKLQSLGGVGEPKALILYHPSRDAHFTDELSLAIGEGLKEAGYSVDRATLTALTPEQPSAYRLLVVVSNTFFWTPDLPTLGVIGGAGSTSRSQQMLERALAGSGARVIGVHAFWTSRPKDEQRQTEPTREVALQLARQLGFATGTKRTKAAGAPSVAVSGPHPFDRLLCLKRRAGKAAHPRW